MQKYEKLWKTKTIMYVEDKEEKVEDNVGDDCGGLNGECVWRIVEDIFER